MSLIRAEARALPYDEPEPRVYWLPNYQALTEAECRELATGRVPDWLADACRRMVDWTLQTGPLDYVGRAETQQRRRKA